MLTALYMMVGQFDGILPDQHGRALEAALVEQLVTLVDRCYGKDGQYIDSLAETVGETAILLLRDRGLIELVDSGRIVGRWTAAADRMRRDLKASSQSS